MELKRLYGKEVKGYAKANGMLAPVEGTAPWEASGPDFINAVAQVRLHVPDHFDPLLLRRFVTSTCHLVNDTARP